MTNAEKTPARNSTSCGVVANGRVHFLNTTMKPIHHQTGTVKDVHSPAGQPMFVPKNFAHLPDCPVCKYGTPQPAGKRIICIDCGAVVGIVEKPTTHDTPT